MNKLFLTILAACCVVSGLSAQSKVQIRIDSVVIATNEALACVPVIADSFPADVASIQFSVDWDAEQLEFAEVRFGDNPAGLTSGDAAKSPNTDDEFLVAFVNPNGRGIDLAPGATLFELCYSTDNKKSASGALGFMGVLVPEFGNANTALPMAFDTIRGSLTYGPATGEGSTTSTTEPNWATQLDIFPNPHTTGPISIEGERLPEFTEINVYNMEGRLVRSYAGNLRRLNLKALARGEYILQMVADDGYANRQFIKM